MPFFATFGGYFTYAITVNTRNTSELPEVEDATFTHQGWSAVGNTLYPHTESKSAEQSTVFPMHVQDIGEIEGYADTMGRLRVMTNTADAFGLMRLVSANDDWILSSERDAVLCAGVTIDLKSIEFTSDHEDGNGDNLLKDKNDNWEDGGAVYAEPEWQKVPAMSNPITHTKNAKISIKLTLDIAPANIAQDDYTLTGKGPAGYLNFSKKGKIAGGAGQVLELQAAENLPDEVTIIDNKDINWEIKFGNSNINLGKSAGHTIYVTYGTPITTVGNNANVLTRKRISFCCQTCDGKASIDDIVLEAHKYVNTQEPPFFNVATNEWPNGTPPIWLMLKDAEHAGSCIAHSNLLKHIIRLLGIDGGELNWVYPSTDLNFAAQETRNINGRQCKLVVVVNGVANNYEGCLELNGKFYPGAFGDESYDSAHDVHTAFAGWPNKLVWKTTSTPYKYYDKDDTEYDDPDDITEDKCIPLP